MSKPSQTKTVTEAPEITSISALFARATWLMLGPLTLMVLLMKLVTDKQASLGGLDVAYGVVTVLMLAGRWWEHRFGAPKTASGEPATSRDLWRYVLILLPAALATWGAAKLAAKLLM